MTRIFPFITILFLISCSNSTDTKNTLNKSLPQFDKAAFEGKIKPVITSETIDGDPDDPAVWVNPTDPAQSLVFGTDKGNGVLYTFDLEGKVLEDKTIRNLKTPNNVDVEYGLMLNDKPTDIVVVTERKANQVRIFSLPNMQPIDGGGLPMFESEPSDDLKEPMGITLYKRPSDQTIWMFVSRAKGPKEGYIWQYFLEDDGTGKVRAILIRKLGNFSGKEDMEALAVDDELGFLYASDESVGIRKYYADPEKSEEELALFGTEGFIEDQEGISIYKSTKKGGYVIVSDQLGNRFQAFPRAGTTNNPHEHTMAKMLDLCVIESDGNDLVQDSLNTTFSKGIFVAMSDDKTFHFYRLEDLGL